MSPPADHRSQDGVCRAVLRHRSEFETLTFATALGDGVTILPRHSPAPHPA